MQPFYFGTSQQQLFGVYHAPETTTVRQSAVLLCQPLGHEYLRAHRAFRNLAVSLAAQGAHVLRFDYFGCGDSAGEGEQATVDQCLADVATAIEELKDTSGASKVSLIGLRVGATLATLTAARRSDVDRIVLWDPVLDGHAYLADVRDLHNRWLADRMGAGAPASARDELLGFPATAAMLGQLSAATLTPLPPIQAKGVWLMVSEELTAYAQLREALDRGGLTAGYGVVPGEGNWESLDFVHQTLLPHAMIRAIASALASSGN
jgi:alpha-beta hydrolase superfamily lysophospholipase